ncbi:MAG: ABC transporter permease [Bellilinea sp.]|jgi:peptide/nickel transport system permease protein
MTEATQSPVTVSPSSIQRRAASNTLSRLAKYALVKILTLGVTIVIGVYITIIIANMGGEVDNIRRGEIMERISLTVSMSPDMRRLPAEERKKIINEMVRLEEQRLGMDQPFILRSFSYLEEAMLLDLGRAQFLTSDSGSRMVRLIIQERLPPTLVLFATANLLLFFSAVFIALGLSRRYGSFLDRMVIALAPTSAAPGWFYGLFLILIFAALLNWLPFGGMVDAPPPDTTIGYALSLLKHMILPTLAILMSSIFLTIYGWRTFFLIFSSEDYVEMAKAKGLSSQMIERRYILRPTLPNIITNFALLIISLWFGAIILETVFNWPGLGRLFYRAIGAFDSPVIVGTTVVYAYLLAITVFLLDFIYALVDPRVKVGGDSQKV